MSRSGTTRSGIINRRARAAQKARLGRFGRRFGLGLLAVGAVAGFSAWAVMSGALDRVHNGLQHKAYVTLADAGFRVENILVEGRAEVDAEVLRAIVNLERGDPIFAFDPAETREMIERLSWVREAHVERRLPNTVYVGLVERTPVALWQHKNKLRVIDAEGVTLTDKLSVNQKSLPIVVGEYANEQAYDLLVMLNAEPDIQKLVEAATWVGDRRWDLALKNDMVVRLPEMDIGLALSRLTQAQEQDKILDKDLSVIDLREKDRITVRTRPGAVQEYQASFDSAKGDNI
jgi:cell division protein FtsQ